MSRTNPTKKRSGLVQANVYRVKKADGVPKLFCEGKKWMSRVDAAAHCRMKEIYDKFKQDQADGEAYEK